MSNPVIGIASGVALGIESEGGTKIAVTDHMDLISENLDYTPVLHRIQPVTGKRYAPDYQEFVSHHDGHGSFVTRLRHAYASILMQWITGDATGPYSPVSDNTDLKFATIECNKASIQDLRLTGGKVDSVVFRSSQNSPLELEFNVLSMGGERDPGDLTAFADTGWKAEAPMMHGALTFDATGHAWLGGVTGPEVRSLEFTISNNLDPEGWTNSTTRKIIPVGLFSLEGSMEIPYNATSAGFWADMVAATTVGFTLTYSDGSNTVAIAIEAKIDGDLPGISGSENVWQTLNFHAVEEATPTAPLIITVSV